MCSYFTAICEKNYPKVLSNARLSTKQNYKVHMYRDAIAFFSVRHFCTVKMKCNLTLLMLCDEMTRSELSVRPRRCSDCCSPPWCPHRWSWFLSLLVASRQTSGPCSDWECPVSPLRKSSGKEIHWFSTGWAWVAEKVLGLGFGQTSRMIIIKVPTLLDFYS